MKFIQRKTVLNNICNLSYRTVHGIFRTRIVQVHAEKYRGWCARFIPSVSKIVSKRKMHVYSRTTRVLITPERSRAAASTPFVPSGPPLPPFFICWLIFIPRSKVSRVKEFLLTFVTFVLHRTQSNQRGSALQRSRKSSQSQSTISTRGSHTQTTKILCVVLFLSFDHDIDFSSKIVENSDQTTMYIRRSVYNNTATIGSSRSFKEGKSFYDS